MFGDNRENAGATGPTLEPESLQQPQPVRESSSLQLSAILPSQISRNSKELKVADMDELNTIIVVTHDVTAACSVADHLWLMGRDRDASGNLLPGSRIVKEYDLIERDPCWHPAIITRRLQETLTHRI